MPKASPARVSFNAGEFSRLVEGRTDIDRYPASMRKALNQVSVPQGPSLRRSGSLFMADAYDHNKYSALIPFTFSDEQALQIEACDERFRFVTEDGLQVYDTDDITAVTQQNPMVFTSAALSARGALVDDQVVLSGFDDDLNMNGRVVKITNKSGDDFTVNFVYPGSVGAVTATANLVYHIDGPYDHTDVRKIRSVQSIDVVYLFCDGYRPRKLSRFASYDWRLETIEFKNGPFMTADDNYGQLTISATGSPISGGTATASTGTAADGFDGNAATFWTSSTNQSGWLQYEFATAKVIDGYYIVPGRTNNDTTYNNIDYAPGDWDFMGSNDGATWFLLDSQRDYVLYDMGRSVFFNITNKIAYKYYRLEITKCTRNGPINPRIAELGMRDAALADITVTLGGTYDKFNKGVGFKTTDVGRLIRLKGSDSFWRTLRIKTYTSATEVVATLLDEPFPDTKLILNWQPGYWSDSTGWPKCGTFFEDRLWLGGGVDAPDLIAGSRSGAYEDFAQRSPANEVLDDSALVVRTNSRKLSSVRWLSNDERGLLAGTGTAEWVVSAANTEQALSARNIKARSGTERGSADMEAVKVDRQILYVQASRRTVREYAYVFESDGYKSPSMSLFASHMGVPRFAQMAYAAEPHSIVWLRRDDGSLVGLTYNRDENVVGWHRHAFDGEVESISAIPSATDKQDQLWFVIKRTVDGQTVRYIERLWKFWDFDDVLENAHFVDSGLRYDGDPIEVLHNLWHLEGKTVCGIADGRIFKDVVVQNFELTLPYGAAEKVTIGLPYTSEGEISRIEAGAGDGTSQGKQKRINHLVAHVWNSGGGEFATWNSDQRKWEWSQVKYREPFDEMLEINLQDGMFEVDVAPGYGMEGTIAFRQTDPLPFNVIAILPQLHTQDR